MKSKLLACFAVLAVCLFSAALGESCPHNFIPAEAHRTQWLVTSTSHKQVDQQKYLCELCNETLWLHSDILVSKARHTFALVSHRHSDDAHTFTYNCVTCGFSTTALVPCIGSPCNISIAPPITGEHAIGPDCSHNYVYADAYRRVTVRTDHGTKEVYHRSSVCELCAATVWTQVKVLQ